MTSHPKLFKSSTYYCSTKADSLLPSETQKSCIIYGNYTREGEERLKKLDSILDEERILNEKYQFPKSRTDNIELKNRHNHNRRTKKLLNTYFNENHQRIMADYKQDYRSLAPQGPRQQLTQSVMPPLSIDTVPERNRVDERQMNPKFIMQRDTLRNRRRALKTGN